MSERSVVINLEIGTEDIRKAQAAMDAAGKSATAFQQEINRVREEQQKLNQRVKEGSVSSEELAQTQVILNKQMKEARQGLAASNKEFTQNQKVVDAARGSNEQLRAQLAILTKEYNALSREERDNTEAGKALQARIKGISDELKRNEGAVGDNRRNVGNYAGSMRDLIGTLGGAIPALKGFKLGSDGVNASLSANPVGFVVQLLMQLVNAFKSNAGFADKLSFAMAGVNKAFQMLIDLTVNSALGKTLAKLFDDPKTAIKELGQMLLDNIINRFKAVGVIVQAVINRDWKALGDGVAQLGTGIENMSGKVKGLTDALTEAGKAGAEAARQLDALTVSQAKTSAAIKQNDIQIRALTKSLRDRTKSEQERIKIANEAADLEIKNAELAEKLAKDALAAEELRLKGKQLSAAEEAKLIELRSNVQAAANERDIAEAERTTRINILLDREKQAEAKITADTSIKEAEREAERLRKIAHDFERERMNALDRRRLELEERAKLLEEAGVSEVEIERFKSDALIEINREEQRIILEGKLAALEEAAAGAKRQVILNKEIKSEEARKAAILDIERELAAARMQTLERGAEEYAETLAVMGAEDAERLAQLEAMTEAANVRLVELDRQRSQAIQDHLDAEAAKAQQQAEQMQQSATGLLGAVGNLTQGLANAMRENVRLAEEQARAAGKSQAEIDKTTRKARKEAHDMAVAAAVVQTLQAAIAAYQSGASIPVVGVALGPIMAAAALAFGFAQVGQMKQQKFQRGGILEGPSHAQGGIPIKLAKGGAVEAEGGEIILTRRVAQTPSLLSKASAINVAAGGVPLVPKSGRKFALGGVVSGSATFAARQAEAGQGLSADGVRDALADAMANQPPPIVRVTDINRVSSQSKAVEVSATL